MGLLGRYRLPAGTVSPTRWNGITYLLERYSVGAGTVSPTCWNGITYPLERYHRVAVSDLLALTCLLS